MNIKYTFGLKICFLLCIGVLTVFSLIYIYIYIYNAREQSKLIQNLALGKEQIVVTYGTSLTQFGAWVPLLEDTLNKKYPGKVKIINSYGSGMASDWGVVNLDTNVLKFNPDTVFIEFAINDAWPPLNVTLAQAKYNLELMIKRIQYANENVEIILMVMNPGIKAHAKDRPDLLKYYQIYRDVAKEKGLLLIDHYPNWMRLANNNNKLFKSFIEDGVHPTKEGCKQIILPEIINSLESKHLNFQTYQKFFQMLKQYFYNKSPFSRDESKNMVTDNLRSVMWQDDTSLPLMSYESTGTYCRDLVLGGISNWQIPTANELSTITNYDADKPYISMSFLNTSFSKYWSRTIYAQDNKPEENRWTISFENGSFSLTPITKTNLHHVRCIKYITH